MDNPKNRLEELFSKYYRGLTTPSETEELMAYIRSTKDDAILEEFLKNSWANQDIGETIFTSEKSSAIRTSIQDSSPRQSKEISKAFRIGWLPYASAAAVILCIGISIWWKSSPAPTEIKYAQQQELKDIKPGGNKAVLTLADGSSIELDRMENGFLAHQGGAEISKSKDGVLVYAANAASANTQLTFNTLATPKGGQFKMQLPDGSKVWLNASSSIRFPSIFSSTERTVEITGEAYFEVAENKNKPFKVKFNQSEVQVLGTSFNIMAYPEEGASKTTLVEGSVNIKNSDQHKHLKPGQQAAVLSTGQIQTQYISLDETVAWKNGLFYFKDTSIEEVMRQISRWYDVEIEYSGKIPLRQFTGQISRNVNLSEVSDMLQFAGVRCRIQSNKMIIDP